MTDKTILLPNGWGDDDLSRFQNAAFENELATYAHVTEWQLLLRDLESVFQKCASHAMSGLNKAEEPSTILLFVTAHNQFLGSVRSTLAGHCLSAYPTGRAVVESALYCWYLSTNKEAAIRWNNKPVSKNELRKWGNEFKFSSLTRALQAVDTPLAVWAAYLHQTAIDFGAHPNKTALYSNMERIQNKDGTVTIRMKVLHEWNPLSIGTAKFVVEAGMIAIRLFTHGFPEAVQTLNLTQNIERLARNLTYLQQTTKMEWPKY